jgi:NitT/TauT family transport system substrate-binding protein
MRKLFLGTIALLLTVAGCSNEETDSKNAADSSSKPTEVTLALNWYPEAEHGGYFAALVHGYFEDEGLKVEIIPGRPNLPVIPRVATGQVTFGVANADRVLVGRAQEADTIALFAPLQMSPRCIMVHEKSGIRSFDDLKDMTLALSNTATFAAYMKKKVPLTNVRIVPYPGNVTQFLLNDDFAQQGYVFSEPYHAKKEGGDPDNLMVSDLGYNPYTSLLITQSDEVEKRPELLRKMVRAVAKGWRKYLEDPDETNAYIQKLNSEMDLDILKFGAETMRDLCITKETPLKNVGRMTPNRWQDLADQLVEAGVIDKGSVDPAKAFTTQFLESPDE